MATIFETETCSRCGGTGHHSYNQVSGTVCFKCGGAKVSFTKRGAEAKRFFDAIREIHPSQVKIGDKIRCHGVKQLTVANIEKMHSGTGRNSKGETFEIVHFVFTNESGLKGTAQDTPKAVVHLIPTDEHRKAALAYQATLTKAGKPRKGGPDLIE